MLLICDRDRPIGIAGVMGGADTEVSETTKHVFIESAHFDAGSIRRTSKALGLSTEASYRFERFVDPELAPLAAGTGLRAAVRTGGRRSRLGPD